MENLSRHGLSQQDRLKYFKLKLDGIDNYENLYFSGKARNERGEFTGIPVDDFHVFATHLYAYADNMPYFNAIRKKGKRVRHIDVGTATNIAPFIASLPYADEMISVDLSPASVMKLQDMVTGQKPLAPHWQDWLELGAILYNIGDAASLRQLDTQRPDLFDQLRHWPNLDIDKKAVAEAEIYAELGILFSPQNPYKGINLQDEFSRKLTPRLGDILDDVDSLTDLERTAQILTQTFLSESISNQLPVVAHAQTNSVQFAEDDALWLSGHMSRTRFYKGFFTTEDLERNPNQKLVELPATAPFLEAMISQFVDLKGNYRMLWEDLGDAPEHRRMVREDSHGGAVIFYGRVNHRDNDGMLKYRGGKDLIKSIQRRAVVVKGDAEQILYCILNETPQVVKEFKDKRVAQQITVFDLGGNTLYYPQ
jgi:hypothetical protein